MLKSVSYFLWLLYSFALGFFFILREVWVHFIENDVISVTTSLNISHVELHIVHYFAFYKQSSSWKDSKEKKNWRSMHDRRSCIQKMPLSRLSSWISKIRRKRKKKVPKLLHSAHFHFISGKSVMLVGFIEIAMSWWKPWILLHCQLHFDLIFYQCLCFVQWEFFILHLGFGSTSQFRHFTIHWCIIMFAVEFSG